jgi:hypothetical protein
LLIWVYLALRSTIASAYEMNHTARHALCQLQLIRLMQDFHLTVLPR